MTEADVLEQKLEETHNEIVQVRCEVIEALRAFYSSASGISVDDAIAVAAKWTTRRHSHHKSDSHSADAVAAPQSGLDARIERLHRTLMSTVEQLQLSGTAPHAQLVQSFTQRERLKRQMAQSKETIALIEQLTAIDRQLSAIDGFLDDAQFVQAARGVQDAQRLLTALTDQGASGDSRSSSASICKTMALQVLKKQTQLTRALKQIYATTVLWKDGALKVSHASLSTRGDLLREFWDASAVLGDLDAKLTDLAKALAQHLIKPALHSATASAVVSRDAGSAALRLVRDGSVDTKMSEVAQVEQQCSSVVSILNFVHAEVLRSDAALMTRLGECLWKIPGNLEAQLMRLLQEKIPQDASALGAYREALAIGVRELEDKLLAIGFAACADSQLRGLVQQLHELYASKRRQTILSHGRDLMRRGYSDSVKIAGATERCNLDASSSLSKKKKSTSGAVGAANDNEVEGGGAFHVPNYRVSAAAHDVVELAHQTLLEACTAEPTCARLLFQTSRDVLFLFRAVVPTLYASDIANDARACMLFHNDCLYIAYHMLTIGHQYKPRLPAPLSRTATMVDMVPAFREAGEKALVTLARAQADELAAGVAALPALSDVDSDAALRRIEDFVKSALYRLTRTSATWREGLPPAVYHKITGTLVLPLARGFVERIVAAPPLSASAGAQLHHLVLLLLECERLFDSPGQADKHVPSLAKLRKLATLLTEPLATVRDQFHAGALAALSPRELAHVVRALYRDSQEKRAFLQLLQ